ncbi:hypothetical protein FVER53590_30316 [Fusarium verticillioides]|nr:hypothetical protein FVER53590_30316 [Fusarium verticillioides]
MVIAETLPKIKELFASAPREGGIDLDIASALVRAVIGSIVANGGALISLSKLRTKDEDTFIHSISVCALLVTFGRKLNLEDGLIRDLGLAGLLHDVGKMAIPEYILQKSEKLSEDEFRIVRMHPRLGFELLSGKSVLPGTVLDICLHHHEKFDGSGYPFGLAGEKIPYVARLAAICDVYDALTTRRAYKGTWSQAQAVDSMMRSRGHFDPSLLRLFVSQMVLSGELM